MAFIIVIVVALEDNLWVLELRNLLLRRFELPVRLDVRDPETHPMLHPFN